MVRLSLAPARLAQTSAEFRPSIREVSLLGLHEISRTPAGEPLAWAGRKYRVATLDGGGYLHVRPADETSR